MKIDFRFANETDYGDIANLISNRHELFFVGPHGEYPLSKDRVKQLITVRKDPTVVLFGGKVIGFGCLADLREGKSATICNVVIGKDYRNQGFGRLLIEYMMDSAFINHHLLDINIGVFNSNTQAILLYHSMGFIPYEIKEMKDFSDSKIALIYMKIMLSQWGKDKSLDIPHKSKNTT